MAVDLSLMKTFVLLYESGSVTRTAEKLSVTQPSVSHSLSRLRRQLGDPLFIRSANGLLPTETARRLYPDLRVGLEVIEAAVAGASQFDPATSTRTFRILATDLGEIALLPSVLAELEVRGPRIRVEVIPLDTGTAAAELQQGRADAAICTPRLPDRDLRRDVLFSEYYVGLCASDHPRITEAPTLEAYLGERHASVDAAIGHSQAEQVLSALGLEYEVALRVKHFATLPWMLAPTRTLALVPNSVTSWAVRAADVRTFTLPVEVPEADVALYTYERKPASPGIDWLRDVIREVLQRPHRGAAAGNGPGATAASR
jgi:DNA-binding transcriptional LysR family regulator